MPREVGPEEVILKWVREHPGERQGLAVESWAGIFSFSGSVPYERAQGQARRAIDRLVKKNLVRRSRRFPARQWRLYPVEETPE